MHTIKINTKYYHITLAIVTKKKLLLQSFWDAKLLNSFEFFKNNIINLIDLFVQSFRDASQLSSL